MKSKNDNIRRHLIYVLIFPVLLFAKQIDLTQFIEIEDGIQIIIPADWVTIPNDVILAGLEQAGISAKYDIGLQSNQSNNWFDYPYILIQIRRSGRVTSRDIQKMGSNKTWKNALAEVGDELSLELESLSQNQFYDPEEHVIWSISKIKMGDSETIVTLAGMILVSDGLIGVFCYSLDREFEYYAPLFESIISSNKIPEYLKYHPGFKNDFDWAKIIATLIIVFMISLVSYYWNIRKKNKYDTWNGKV